MMYRQKLSVALGLRLELYNLKNEAKGRKTEYDNPQYYPTVTRFEKKLAKLRNLDKVLTSRSMASLSRVSSL